MNLFTLVTFDHVKGGIPQVALAGRPFTDCESVGINFRNRVVIDLLGDSSTNLVTVTRRMEEEIHSVKGNMFKVFHEEARLLGKVKLASYYIVED
jgi:hypothetical protein